MNKTRTAPPSDLLKTIETLDSRITEAERSLWIERNARKSAVARSKQLIEELKGYKQLLSIQGAYISYLIGLQAAQRPEGCDKRVRIPAADISALIGRNLFIAEKDAETGDYIISPVPEGECDG